MRHRSLLPFLFPLVALPAQAAPATGATGAKPAPAGLLQQVSERHRDVVFDAPGDGRLHAAARTYKMAFAADAATFVPYLGADAARNFPVAFALDGATVGGEPLALARPAPRRHGAEVVYDRGTCTEHYRLTAEHAEQLFCFTTLPARGELAVQIGVATELAPRTTGAGLEFTNERGAVTYSQAVAIDARGRRAPLATELRDGGIRITVPAAFVAAAELPLWIDPIVATRTIYANTYVLAGNDIAHDGSLGEYMVAWSREWSQADHDVFVQRFDATFAPVGSTIPIDLSADSWRRPRIAALEAHDRFLVVARCWNATATFFVAGRVVTQSAGPVLPIEGTQVPGGLGRTAINPDVGGDGNTATPVYWNVVFTVMGGASDDVYMRRVRFDGTLVDPAATPIANTPFDEYDVRISNSDGDAPALSQAWGIVWLRDHSELWGTSVQWNGTVLAAPRLLRTGISNHTTWDVSSPTDDRNGERHFLLVTQEHDAGTASMDVVGMLLDRTFQTAMTARSLSAVTLPLAQAIKAQTDPSVDCDGARFAVAFTHHWSATDTDVYVATVMPDATLSNFLGHDFAAAASTSDDEQQPMICATRSGGGAGVRYAAVWSHTVATGGHVEGGLYDGRLAGAQFAQRPTACGGLAIAYGGEPAPGSAFSVSLSGHTGIAGFLAGTPVNVPLGVCPGCTQGVVGDAWVATTMNVPVPANPALVGATIAFQAFDVTNAACLGFLRVSDTVDVTVR